jgi:hypothetical protein
VTHDQLTAIATIASAVVASAAGWALVRANRTRIDTETEERRDAITRRLRDDLDAAHGLVAKVRAREALWTHLVRAHWLAQHPDEPVPTIDDD